MANTQIFRKNVSSVMGAKTLNIPMWARLAMDTTMPSYCNTPAAFAAVAPIPKVYILQTALVHTLFNLSNRYHVRLPLLRVESVRSCPDTCAVTVMFYVA